MRHRPFRSLVRDAHLPRILVVYVSAGVGMLQTADVLQNRLGLPDWFFPGILTLLLTGLPFVVATALAQAAHGRDRRSEPTEPAPATPSDLERTERAGSPLAAGARPRARLLTWRNVALAGATGFGLLVFGTAGYMGLRVAGIGPTGTLLGKGVLQPRDRVVVVEVENRTPDRGLGAVVTEALRTRLEESRSVALVRAAEIRSALVRMRRDSAVGLTEGLAREVALRVGAKAVVTGEIGAAGRGYLLSAHMVPTDTAAAPVSVLEEAKGADELIPAIDRLSGKLRERIGESLRSIRASPPLEQVTTSSLQALRLYSQATQLMDRTPGEPERVLPLLQAAVALDTGFASAYRAMGVVLINTGLEHARGMAMLRAALERSDRLPFAERYRTQALYDWNRGAYERAATAYRALLELNPADAGALNNLGGTYADRGEYAHADSCFRGALRLDPADAVAAYNHADAFLAFRQYDSARAFVAANFRTRHDAAALYVTARLTAATQPPESLLALVARARADAPESQAGLFATVAEVNAFWAAGRQREGDARSVALTAALRMRRLDGDALGVALARARMRASVLGDAAGAARATDSALAVSPPRGMRAEDRPYLALVYTYALSGRPGAGRRALAEYQAALQAGEVVPEPAAEKLADGAIALTEGRFADAVTSFRQAHDLPVPSLMPTRGCRACATLMLARAYEALGERDSAIASYERFLEQPDPDRFWTLPSLAPAEEHLSELYAGRGDPNRAALHGAAFLRLWEGADPALQPRVAAMRRRVELLGTDRPLP